MKFKLSSNLTREIVFVFFITSLLLQLLSSLCQRVLLAKNEVLIILLRSSILTTLTLVEHSSWLDSTLIAPPKIVFLIKVYNFFFFPFFTFIFVKSTFIDTQNIVLCKKNHNPKCPKPPMKLDSSSTWEYA